MIQAASDEYLTAKQAAARVDLDYRHVSRLAKQGRLTGHKIGPVWVILASSIDRYVNTPRRKPGPKPKGR